jgi:ribosomal protein S18 acetylase RimI-like enzyme
MKKKILVRDANTSDILSVQRVITLAFETVRHIYHPSPSVSAKRPQIDGSSRLVALQGGLIVGTVQYTFDDDRLHLIALATHPAYRQQGVAGQIITYLIKIGRCQHQRALSLSTIRETGNIPIFEKLGFEVLLETPAEDVISVRGWQLYEVYMEREIKW